jgi:hypothetical protein
MSIEYFATHAEAQAAADASGGKVARVLSPGNPWEVRSGSDAVADLRPTVTKWQLVQACADAGITEAQIDTAVALLTAKRQRFWRHTQIIDRDNPFSSGLRTHLVPSPTPAAWNMIFIAASQLNPLEV